MADDLIMRIGESVFGLGWLLDSRPAPTSRWAACGA
jgi:hypothetical protein